MRTLLKSTLDYWKDKTNRWRKLTAIYRSRLSRRDDRIERLEHRIAELEEITTPQQVAGHHYPAQMIVLAVFIVVAGGSLRLAARVIEFYAELMGWSYGKPSHVTVRNWVMRCGLSALQQDFKAGETMTVIIDESIQIGKEKLLLMLGIPNSLHQTQCGELCHSDVKVLGLSVRSSWKGEAIAEFMTERIESLGIEINMVISDCGTNLLKACKLLSLSHIADCSHHLMNGVKAIFKDDTALHQLCSEVGKLRRRLCMTDYAHLIPPTLRDKDRFCRMFQLNDWIKRVKLYEQNGEEGAAKYLTFLAGTQALQLRLQQVEQLVKISGVILRRCGLSQMARQLFEQRTSVYLATQSESSEAARNFIAHMKTYFDRHQKLTDNGARWLCCSEVIESMFGRYKNKGGMKVISSDVLVIPLYGQSLSAMWVKNALENTSLKKLTQWQIEQVCINRYGIFKQLKNKYKSCSAVDK